MKILPIALLVATACAATPAHVSSSSAPAQDGIHVQTEQYTLSNGLRVTLHEDHSLPKVVINTWFAVGSKDEAPGRTGFAHLFEHLMFMGTGRVPDDGFDVLMEAGGGSNNASTSRDITNYFSIGPSSLLPTLLWLDADRLEALDDFMTQEKLDKQRAVVRNERRQTTENVPYGKSRLLLTEALFPDGHPYQHSVIGSHEDLEAATVGDVVRFFRKHYVPGNASLVVAGDFDPDEVKRVIEETFGAVPAKQVPKHITAEPVQLTDEIMISAADAVEFEKLTLAWHSPPFYHDGDAEMDLIASVLSGGPSTRLEKRLVIETEMCLEVGAYQASSELGSSFVIEALAAPGADLDAIKTEILAVVDELKANGPTKAELGRIQAQMEVGILRGMESLQGRADQINRYIHHLGTPDGFQVDLDRYANASPMSVTSWARKVFGPGRVDMRIYPEESPLAANPLDERPADFAAGSFEPPTPVSFELSNGVPVYLVERPGTGLFSGQLMVRGGELLTPVAHAGLAPLSASLMNSGAGGLDSSEFADAVETLGASVGVGAGRSSVSVSVSGLTSRLSPTLDLFRDAALAPNLDQDDFDREQSLALADIASRADNPRAVAGMVEDMVLFGADDPRGRPVDGSEASVSALTLDDVKGSLGRYLHPANAAFVFVGDFSQAQLERELESRFGSWTSDADATLPALEPLVTPAPGKIVLVHRPDAPQTVVTITRPVPPATGAERAARRAANIVFGGTFTSRLNSNLRERNGYTYGAFSGLSRNRDQYLLSAGSAVRTDVTGASLTEFKHEFDAMHANGITEAELPKAVKTTRRELVETAETTSRMARTLAGLVRDGRPLDAVARDLAVLDELDLAQVNAKATSGLYGWDQLQIVLVGDRDAVLPQLAEAGFPAPIELDTEGRPVSN